MAGSSAHAASAEASTSHSNVFGPGSRSDSKRLRSGSRASATRSVKKLPVLLALCGCLLSCCCVGPCEALEGYALQHSYIGPDFFSHFWFWADRDLTNGHVDYVDLPTAQAENLISASKDQVYMSADRGSVTHGAKRKSVKIFSNEVFNGGLFVLSLDHMPTGCGTWPAFWMTGGNSEAHWPSWGEYDIIEGVHNARHVNTALHTSEGCQQAGVESGRDFEGRWQAAAGKVAADDCYIHAAGQWLNQGCGQTGPMDSMGPGFNQQGGGTYVGEWSPWVDGRGYFRTWFFRNGTEPADLLQGHPNPDSWPLPYSKFDFGPDTCPQTHFKNMRLVFDLTFCGDLAGPSYAAKCPAEAQQMTCEDLVSNHPEKLAEAFWSLRRLETYLWQEIAPPTTPAPAEEPSCKLFGCSKDYHPGQVCQCNLECASYGNCCPDTGSFCRVKSAPDSFRSAFGSNPGPAVPTAENGAKQEDQESLVVLKRFSLFSLAPSRTATISGMMFATCAAGLALLFVVRFGSRSRERHRNLQLQVWENDSWERSSVCSAASRGTGGRETELLLAA